MTIKLLMMTLMYVVIVLAPRVLSFVNGRRAEPA
jgi:hypothetical protein